MGEVLEICLSSIDPARLPSLVATLAPNAAADGAWSSINLKRLEMAGISFSNALLIRQEDEGTADIEIVVDADDVPAADNGFLERLQATAGELASASGARTWFAGMEPAHDLATRYFTETQTGPLTSLVRSAPLTGTNGG